MGALAGGGHGYHKVFDGECTTGTEIIMFTGKGDNPGNEPARVAACANKCKGAGSKAATAGSQVVYQQGTTASDNVDGTLTGLVPGARYTIGVEVLRNDLGHDSEYVKSVTVGGTNLGECKPDGGDYDCTFFQCPFNTMTVVTASASGTVPVSMVFTGHSWDCDCDTSSWECSRESTIAGRQPMTAVARFSWVPAKSYPGFIVMPNDVGGYPGRCFCESALSSPSLCTRHANAYHRYDFDRSAGVDLS
jgi:hypothetical protein